MAFFKRNPIYLPDLLFNEIIKTYETLFKRDDLCVLKYEEMRDNSAGFFEQLKNFIDPGLPINMRVLKKLLKEKINTSPSEENINLLRFRNLKNVVETCFKKKPELDETYFHGYDSMEIMSEPLKEKLSAYFSGRSQPYY